MQSLIHPSHEVDKVYLVTVTGDLPGAPERLAAIQDLDGEMIRPASVELISRTDDRAELRITIHEGKNRQIRRMCEKAGLHVCSLRRVQEGKLRLGDLKPGKWRYLTDIEIKDIKGR